MAAKPFIINEYVRWSDVDYAGIIFYGAYVRFFEIAETELFREAGRVFRYEDELFARASWVAVFLGQNILPRRPDPIVAALPPAEVRQSLESMHAAMLAAVRAMPAHAEFIQRYCPSVPG